MILVDLLKGEETSGNVDDRVEGRESDGEEKEASRVEVSKGVWVLELTDGMEGTQDGKEESETSFAMQGKVQLSKEGMTEEEVEWRKVEKSM